MPWPMVHFSVSYRLFESPHPAFLLGCIAPDAVWVRQTDFKTAYGRAHFSGISTVNWQFLTDFYNSRIQIDSSEEYKLFIKGYLNHIMADRIWGNFKREVGGTDKSIRDVLWQEEEQNDFNIYKSVPWRETVQQAIKHSPLYELNDMYWSNELDRWRHQIFERLQQTENEPCIENQFFTSAVVSNLISKIANEFSEWIKTVNDYN